MDGENWYVYANNNPVMFIDPFGLKVWLIHGTFSDPSTWTDDFITYIGDIFDEEVEPFEWGGKNNPEARTEGAIKLEKEITAWKKDNPDEAIRIVGHSHGGNVAIEAINNLANNKISVDTLITLGTPVRDDYQLSTKVGQHLNIYNYYDLVQTSGGPPNKALTAERLFKNATNIMYTGKEIRTNQRPNTRNHSVMHSNVNAWESHITPKIILPSNNGGGTSRGGF